MLNVARFALESVFKVRPTGRPKLLAKLFGVFTEDLVRLWCSCPQAPYEDLGRPTLRMVGEGRGSTLDFTFRKRRGGRLLVGELKCWPEYQEHRHLHLDGEHNIAFLQNEGKPAWRRFLQVAKDPTSLEVYLQGRRVPVSGAALVWCGATVGGRRWAKKDLGLAEVLSLEDMIDDLLQWDVSAYVDYLQERADWCREFFAALKTLPRAADLTPAKRSEGTGDDAK
jgi:hypothetical protein